ncbi:MAG: type II toxin-antitoxin system RelE/ParE family toxin [Myxacorys californica WJT36-NPBG1]|jgi:plasmid stabilization system protein ParE|nr:type II toxin-antitoxin system RelE/ParE family toxin [Myxacorys californica WJT36-NPBG1]
MSHYFFTPQAKLDLKDITKRIALDNPVAAKRLLAEISRSEAFPDRMLEGDVAEL